MAYFNGKKIMFTAKSVFVNKAEEYDKGYSEGYVEGIEVGFNDGDAYRRAMMFGIIGRDFETIEKEHLDGLPYVGGYAFYNYTKLKTIRLPESVDHLKGAAFQNCTALTTVELNETLKYISANAFQGCTALTALTIPASVQDIAGNALRIGSATNKATITMLGTTPPTISSTTFLIGSLSKIIVPVGCGEAYKTATNWSAFADYIEEAAE